MGKLHNLQSGCSDASVITTDTATYLIDCHRIGEYANLLPANKVLRGVFITHQHHDHYSGLSWLWDNGYRITFLVYSPYERRFNDGSVSFDEWNEFNGLRDKFQGAGTELRAPYRQESFDKAWWVAGGVNFWVLGPFKDIGTSETRELHDACLVVKAHMGSRSCLFTGDASDSSLSAVASKTTHICDDILHASHHGSINGADLSFIKKCSAKYTVISTEPGVYSNNPHATALQRYQEHTSAKVYRTDVDGSLTWTF